MAIDPDDPYALLGVEPGVDAAELRRAWRRLALRWHPDRAGAASTARFQALSVAYGVLSDPVSRAAYDRRHGIAAARAQQAPAASATAPRKRAPGVMLSRLSGSLDALLASGIARRVNADTIDLFLDPEEVAQGGMVSISMRVPVRCSACEGDAGCSRCKGKGSTTELFSAWLAVPPGVAEGALLAPSALLRGMRPVSFRVCFRPLFEERP